MKQPEALRLADALNSWYNKTAIDDLDDAAVELQRLHEANQAMLEALKDLLDGNGDITSERIEKARAAIAKGEQQ